MNRSWTIGRQLVMGFAVPLFILLALGIASYQSSQGMLATNERVGDTHRKLGVIAALLSDLQDIEGGQRGYVITGKEEFLKSYQTGVEVYPQHLAELRALAREPAEREKIAALQETFENRIAWAIRSVALRKREGLEASVALVATGEGRRLTGVVRDSLGAMIDDEKRALEARSAEARAASGALTRTLVGGTLGAVLLVGLTAAFIVRRLGRSIGGATQQIRSAAAELEAAATQQVKGARGQAQAAAEVSTATRGLVSTARRIALSAQRVKSLAGDTSQAAQSGGETVTAAQQAVVAVRDEVHKIVAHMVDLGFKTQEIGGIVDIINELSEQTNILAINATIESVGAGEAGRRFGVVAGEIRKLADRVTSSTREIRRLIEEIRGSASTTVLATEQGARAVENGTRRFEEVTESFARIAGFVSATVDATRQIELSTKEQTGAMEQVSIAVTDVAQTAVETEASSTQTLQTASELATLARELVRLIRRDEAVMVRVV